MMIKPYALLFPFLFALSFCSFVHAQLHIVKEHELCKYGLKNETGDWIVPATYRFIYEIRRSGAAGFCPEDIRYMVDDGQKRGLLSFEGHVIIPVIYDIIWDIGQVIHVRLNGLNGAYTLDGELILPAEYQLINENRGLFFGHKHKIEDRGGPNTTTFANYSGTCYFKDLQGYVCCFENRKYAILQISYEQPDSELGVIDLNGNPVVPPIYDRILIGNDHFIVSKEGKTTILDVSGNPVLPEIASIQPTGEGSLSDTSTTYLVKNSDSLVGLLDSKFKLIFPLIYDSIVLFPYANNSVLKGQFFSNRKTGIFNSRYDLVIPPVYDDLKVIYSEVNALQNLQSWFFLYQQNGKYGVLDFSGKKITEATYDLVKNDFSGREYEKLFLRNGNDLFVFTNGGNSMQKIPFQFRNRAKNYYRWEDKLVELHDTADDEYTQVVGKYYGKLAFLDHWYNHLFHPDGEEILEDRIQNAQALTGNLLLITTKSGNMGVIDNHSGKWILDTIHRECSTVGVLNNELFLMNASEKWILYDTSGNRKLTVDLDQKEIWFNQKSNDSLSLRKVVVNGHTGVLDKDYQFILDPVFINVGLIDPGYLVVITESRRTGLFDLHGNMLVDTIYTDFLPVFGNYHVSMNEWEDQPGFKKEASYLFKNNDQSTWINSEGKRIVSSGLSDPQAALIDSILYTASMRAQHLKREMNQWKFDFVPDGSQNLAVNAFKPFLSDKERNAFFTFPCQEELYAFLKADYEQQLPSAYYNPKIHHGFTTRKECNNSVAIIEKKDIGSRYFSLDYVLLDTRSYVIGREINNYLVDSCKFRKMELEDVFTDPPSLVQELIKALKSYDNLHFDCDSPKNLLQSIHFFSFSREGIVLYLVNPDSPEYPEIELLIPKAHLLLHKSLEWIYPYLD